MSTYTKVVWVDEVPSATPVEYILTDDINGILGANTTIAVVTPLTTVGTPMTATNLNRMDDGIYQAQEDANAAQATADAAAISCTLAEYLDDLKDNAVYIPLNGSTALTTNDKAYHRIPAKLDGGTLVDVAAMCVGASSSGAITLTVKKLVGAVWTTMLSANITIDAGEIDTSTAAVPATIGAGNTVAEGDHIEVAVTGAGTGVTFCGAELSFRPAA